MNINESSCFQNDNYQILDLSKDNIISLKNLRNLKKTKDQKIVLIAIGFIEFLLILSLCFYIIFKKKKNQCNDITISKEDNLKIYENALKNNNFNNIKEVKNLFLYHEDNITNYQAKNKIHISMALDNNAIYPTLVSMTSSLENCNKTNNILIYYLLLSFDFSIDKIEIFESLKKHYKVVINYYIIPNIFTNISKWKDSYTVYYKLLLPLMFPNIERMIFLDGDTLIFKDILEMYQLDFKDKYILGYPFHSREVFERLKKTSKYYINAGVLLMNLSKMRESNLDLEVLLYTIKNSEKFSFLEQDTINIIYAGKIGLLPLKYGIYLIGSLKIFKKYYLPSFKHKINLNKLMKAIKNPSIVHLVCCNPKVWYYDTSHENQANDMCKRFQKDFYFYAKKTDYYSEIYSLYMLNDIY